MKFNDSDVRPNRPEPVARLVATMTQSADARWRNVPSNVNTIDISARLDLDRAAKEGQLRV